MFNGPLPPLPSELTLFGCRWTIHEMPDLMKGQQDFGNVLFNLSTINVEASLAQDVKWLTLCHEVVHIIDGALSLAVNEETTQRFEVGIWQFNKQLLQGAAWTGVCRCKPRQPNEEFDSPPAPPSGC